MTKLPMSLKPFFWEFDLESIELDNHRTFVIERLLEKGKMDQVRWVFKTYSRSVIQGVVESSENISTGTRNFWKSFFAYATV